MDLSLNFAVDDGAKSRKSKSSRGQAAGVRKQHVKQQQQPAKQGNGASKGLGPSSIDRPISSTAATSLLGRSNHASTSKASKQSVKSSNSSNKSVNGTQKNKKRIDGHAPLSRAETNDDAALDADAEQKRPFISSLFPRFPAGPYEEEADRDNDATTADQPPSSLDPSNAPSIADSFDSMPLPLNMISHLKGKMGLANPTLIQKLAVPFLADENARKRDAILQAQTGSGKTLSYLLPIVSDLLRISDDYSKSGKSLDRSVGTLAIILVPTRELAVQIFEVAMRLLSFPADSASASHRWITPGLLTGGAHRQHEKARLRKGVPLLIATVGRVSLHRHASIGQISRIWVDANLYAVCLLGQPGRLLDHLEATKAFRLAGEAIRKPKNSTRRRGLTDSGDESEDEFDIEDNVPEPRSATLASDDVSSDEDFENRGVSRSYRANMPIDVQEELSLNPHILLRWLVLDEADRLMDMGFEPQIKSIVDILASRLDKRKAALGRALKHLRIRDRQHNQRSRHVELDERRTLLCSATIEGSVERLAGVALKEPLVIKGDNGSALAVASSKSDATGVSTQYAPPTQLSQYFAVVEPKLRFVTLVAVLRQILLAPSLAKTSSQKILVFLSCTDSVDLHWQALSSLTMGGPREDDQSFAKSQSNPSPRKELSIRSESSLLPGTSIYRLHGSLDLPTRLSSLKGYSSASQRRAVMFCTSVAARGLDVQDVTAVIQYDLPTEGGVTEYVHRVGRTARAGAMGQSWTLLLPSEVPWVRWAESEMHGKNQQDKSAGHLQERQLNSLLKAGYGGKDRREYEHRATDVQMAYERWVAEDSKNSSLARKAFSSHIRAYATHPSNEKEIFHVKKLHLGHLAKAFGLREAPTGIVKSHTPKTTSSSKAEKRKRGKDGTGHMSDVSEEEDDRDGPLKGNKIPRSGRALEGKGLHGPKASTRGDFNIASSDILGKVARKKF